MELLKKKKKIKLIPLIFKLLLLSFVFYIIFLLISQQGQINKKKKELDEVNAKLQVQLEKNEELKKSSQNNESENEEYIEKSARENLDLSKKGERIFINISGN